MTVALLALQGALQQHLLQGDTDIAAHIASGRGIGVERRLQIYRHAYRTRLVSALRDSFGHTARYLGDDWFNRAAGAYVDATPSTQPNLNDYGAALPDWLAAAHPNDLDISELARLDWTLRRAFDGPDAPVLALADLAAVAPAAWATLGFALHPTATRLRFTHNTLALWSALDQEQAPPPAAALPAAAEVLVWRRGQQPHFRSLPALESAALAALPGGFAAMCGVLAAQFPSVDVSTEAGSLLRRWVDEELLSAVVNDPAA